MNDETLVLYYYGDGLSEEARATVASALENEARVRERYRALRQSLDGLHEPPAARAPADMAARWHGSIARAAAAERARPVPGPRGRYLSSFTWAALAAALAAGIGIGHYAARYQSSPPSTVEVSGITVHRSDPAAAPAAFHRGLKAHLQRTRQDLARLAPAEGQDQATLILDIVRQNRLFERTAQAHDAGDVARLLRAFEPVLLRLAAEDVSRQDAVELAAKLEFELEVMLTRIQRRASPPTGFI